MEIIPYVDDQIDHRGAHRDWVYTLNNYTEEEVSLVLELEAQYHIVAKEVAPTTGTPHLQGYFYLTGRGRRLGGLRKMKGFKRARFAPAKGTAEQNRLYITGNHPSKNFVLNEWVREGGVMPQGQGARNDIAQIKQIVKNGGTMRDVLEIATSYQAARMGELCLKVNEVPIDRDPNKFRVRWYWGPTGTGKTHAARQEAGPDCWVASESLQWWDGYDGHKNVIFDDYRRDMCKFRMLLHYLEHWGWRVPIKGGFRTLRYINLWITAPLPPQIMWEGRTAEDLNQLLDRIHEVREFSGESKRRQLRDKLMDTPVESPDGVAQDLDFGGPKIVPTVVPKVGGNNIAPTFYGDRISDGRHPLLHTPEETKE